MSDTPRTDAAWSSGFDPVVVSAAELARRLRERCAELERENAALKEELAPLRETVGVRGDAVTSRDDIAYWCKLMDRAGKADRLERENAALREENAVLRRGNERLIKTARDVLESFVLHKKVETGHPCPENMVICAELRATLDAARKEGQP